MPSITVRVDLTGVPHSFIRLDNGAGFQQSYGFAPKVPDAPYGPGVIRDENQHPYDFETTYEISNEQYEAVRQFITNSINNPWDYSVHRANCSAWVNDALRAAGIHDPVSVSWHWLPNPYEHAIDIVARNAFTRAKRWTRPRDPIILDLDGNGLETVGLAANVYFDFDADGVLTKTGWAGKNDALLVWDRNGNGRIDTGAELIGDFTPLPNGTLAPNGFAALAVLDANGDGVIDASDPAFAELKLWRDTSQDGQTGSGELISLQDAGIVSLNLAHTLKNQVLANGNQLTREGTFTRLDGTTSAMGEFNLAIDTFDTKFANEIEIPEALKTLPNMGGAGNVRELQQAATLSPQLAGLLAQFQSATTCAEQKALLDESKVRRLPCVDDNSGQTTDSDIVLAGDCWR
jgi:hypothetical protein